MMSISILRFLTTLTLSILNLHAADRDGHLYQTSEESMAKVGNQENMEKEAKEILAYAQNHKTLNLAVGVRTHEDTLLERYNENWVFLDTDHQLRMPGRTITADFNNVEQLTYYADMLPGLFDEIVLDLSTYKFTEWTRSLVQQFAKLLKKGGRFVFSPYSDGKTNITSSLKGKNWEELIQHNTILLKELADKGEFGCYDRPIIFPIKEGAFEDEIKNVLNFYQQTLPYLPDSGEPNFRDKQQIKSELLKNGIEIPEGFSIRSREWINDFENSKEYIAREINRKHFDRMMWKDYIGPLNLSPILKTAFQEVKFLPPERKLFPIQTGYSLGPIIVIAIK